MASKSGVDVKPRPRLFDRSADPTPLLAPIAPDPVVARLHRVWESRGGKPPTDLPGISKIARYFVRRRTIRIEHDLLASLIQAVDVIAHRCDILSTKLHDLESLLAEVIDVTSEELTAIRASRLR